MKNELVRAALAAVALGTVLLSFGCQGGANNKADNTNANRAMPTVADASPSPPAEECTGTTDDKIKKIKAAIDAAIAADDKLKGQKFSISLQEDRKVISMQITGTIVEKEGRKLSHFVKLFDKYLSKGCVQIVRFKATKTGTDTNTNTNTKPEMKMDMQAATTDFEWILCEEPLKPCSDGSCC